MLISQTFPRRFATAEDIGAQTPTLHVARVTIERCGPTEKPVVWFIGARKGVILGPTLARQLAELIGDDTDGWTGKAVQLHTVRLKVNGEARLAIRARAARPAATERCTPDHQLAAHA